MTNLYRPLLLAATLLATPVVAQTPPTPPAKAKAIRLIEAAKPLTLTATTTRRDYRVDDPVSLRVEVDRPAYLYIYSRGADGRSRFVYPRVDAAAEPLVAGPQVLRNLLAADRAGEEELVVFAADKPLDLVDATTSRDTPTRDFERKVAAAGVRIGATARAPQVAGVSLPQVVTLKIVAGGAEAAATTGVAVIATDKTAYKVGAPVQLVYGANKPGHVQLFMVYPNGDIEPLLTEKFDAPGVKTRVASADAPGGDQTILAVWSTDGKVTARSLRDGGAATGGDAGKALRLRDSGGAAGPAVSSRRITVEE